VPATGGEPQLIETRNSGIFDFNPVYVPGEQALYFSGGRTSAWGLLRVAVSPVGIAQGEAVSVKNTGLAVYKQLNFSADGRTMAYSALSTINNIWSVRVFPGRVEATGPPQPLTSDTNLRKTFPMFSTDGKKLAYIVWQVGAGRDLWVMDSDGRNARPLTAGAYESWFPGGQRLAIQSFQEDTSSTRLSYS
jgi:hypothetical protein